MEESRTRIFATAQRLSQMFGFTTWERILVSLSGEIVLRCHFKIQLRIVAMKHWRDSMQR